MKIKSSSFWLPKQGNASDEYEDAFAPEGVVEEQCEIYRCAVADGAAESSFSKLWAKLLVDGYCGSLDIKALQEKWLADVSGLSLEWYAEQKAKSGSFAALVGLTINDDRTFEMKAIGDSCLAHIRGERLALIFPISDASQFDNSPHLLSSKQENNQDLDRYWLDNTGSWEHGDHFFLMTDALSKWFLQRQEKFGDAPARFSAITNQEDFTFFVETERASLGKAGQPSLKNDDATLLTVQVFA